MRFIYFFVCSLLSRRREEPRSFGNITELIHTIVAEEVCGSIYDTDVQCVD